MELPLAEWGTCLTCVHVQACGWKDTGGTVAQNFDSRCKGGYRYGRSPRPLLATGLCRLPSCAPKLAVVVAELVFGAFKSCGRISFVLAPFLNGIDAVSHVFSWASVIILESTAEHGSPLATSQELAVPTADREASIGEGKESNNTEKKFLLPMKICKIWLQLMLSTVHTYASANAVNCTHVRIS